MVHEKDLHHQTLVIAGFCSQPVKSLGCCCWCWCWWWRWWWRVLVVEVAVEMLVVVGVLLVGVLVEVRPPYLGQLLLQGLQDVVHGALAVLLWGDAHHCLAVHRNFTRLHPQLGHADGVAHCLGVHLRQKQQTSAHVGQEHKSTSCSHSN